MLALFVNAAILILAAATFHKAGQTGVVEIGDAQRMLAPLVGSLLAPKLFAVALLACGLNSAVTATLAGQIVMEGFINFRIAPWARRLVTRSIAILPAVLVTIYYGANGSAFLLVLSQVVLAFQLPFAIIPLIQFTASRGKMGPLVSPLWLTTIASLAAAIIIALNAKLIADVLFAS
jgi:manganese transport protein